LILLAIPFAGILLLAGAYRLWSNAQAAALHRVQAQIKSDGLPTVEADFLYREESGGNLLIYSIGPDLIDNRGVPGNAKGKKDIVWSVRRHSPADPG